MNKKFSFYLLALCILLTPRVMRIVYPEIFIEDDFYLQNAFLMTLGERPYHDFILNHFPLLEMCLKVVFDTFGVSVQTAEVLTQSLVVLNSFLILILGLKIKDKFAGLASAFLYAWSSLIFKYHVFEREIFTGTCVLIGLSFYFLIKKERSIKYFLIGFMFLLSSLIKFTGALPLIVIIAFFVYEKRFKEASILLVSFLIPITIITLWFYAQYGYPFYFQVFLFHFLKGSRLFLGRARVFIRGIDCSLFLGILGFLFYRDNTHKREWTIIRLLFLAYPLFFLLFSSTVWSHNLIEMLPFACFLGGACLSNLRKILPDFFRAILSPSQVSSRNYFYLFFIIVLFFITRPWKTDDSSARWTFYGFGSIPRKEITELAQYIKSHSTSEDVIFCPFPILSVSSNRKTIVNYWENVGVEAWARENMKREGFWKTMEKANSINFMELLIYTKGYAYASFWKEAESKNIPLLVKLNPNHSVQLSSLQKPAKELLDYCSGERLLTKEHFEIFTFVKKIPLDPNHGN